MVSEAKQSAAKSPPPADPGSPSSPSASQPRVPQRLQRARIGDAMRMVEREYVLSSFLFYDQFTNRFLGLRSSSPSLLGWNA